VSVVELEIPARPSEVARVRRAIRAALVRYGLDRDHADVAQLLGSELVMNAVLHGGEPIVVRVSVERDSTVIEVSDGSTALPVLGAGTERRRGLHVVDAMSTDWGTVVSEQGGGKTVWCSIAHTRLPAAPDGPRRRAEDRSG
jgi:anti-sigma regulatory factor (Ser/Thr protein kinase)